MNIHELTHFIDNENKAYMRITSCALPPIDPRVVEITDSPLLQRYCSTRLFYYGGGDSSGCKAQSIKLWCIEAFVNPQPLN